MILKTGGSTTDPILGAICQARNINTMSGGAVIAPWELGELPDDWLDAFEVLANAMSWPPEGV